jgi:hypothetical protein
MNKIHLLLIGSLLILTSGIFLSIFWWFNYSFGFGSCTVISYNIAPGFNCEFNSILDCETSYCAELFVFFRGSMYNYTSFIPISFHDDNINSYSCWNVMSFSNLKSYMLDTYPIGEVRTCYINFQNRLILSQNSFYKMTTDIRISGIILMSSGAALFVVYLLSLYFLRDSPPLTYQVL